MTSKELLSHIDYIHDSGCGRGGFKLKLTPRSILYNDNAVLDFFEGEYVNPIGPFTKWIKISAFVYTPTHRYSLCLKDNFWQSCSEYEFEEKYLRPFICTLKKWVEGEIRGEDITELCAIKDVLSSDISSRIISTINYLKNKKP